MRSRNESVAAVIDVGSNSAHLLVAGIGRARLRPLLDESVQLGLGPVVDRTGHLGEPATAGLVDALRTLRERSRAHASTRPLLVGTEPFRRAADAGAAIERIHAATGLRLRVLSPAAEGRLAAEGATGGRPVRTPLLVIDLGGGSTEVVLLRPGRPARVLPVPAGSARLAAAHLHGDPPGSEGIDLVRGEVRELAGTFPPLKVRSAIVTGGTGTNVNRLLGRARTTTLTRADLRAALALATSGPAAPIAARTGLSERRVAQLPAGILLLLALAERQGVLRIRPSDASIREGLLLREAARRARRDAAG